MRQPCHDTRSHFPPGGVTNGPCCSTQSGTNWAIEILPYLEQDALYKLYDQNLANEHPTNLANVNTKPVKTYNCPSDTNAGQLQIVGSGPPVNSEYRMSSYRAMSGRTNDTAWFHDFTGSTLPSNWKGVLHNRQSLNQPSEERIGSVTDGTSNTVMVSERHTRTHPNRGAFWAATYAFYNQSAASTQSRTLLPDYLACVAVGGVGNSDACKSGWGSFHTGGMNAVYVDGSVRFVPQTIDTNVWVGLATIAGGEVIPGN